MLILFSATSFFSLSRIETGSRNHLWNCSSTSRRALLCVERPNASANSSRYLNWPGVSLTVNCRRFLSLLDVSLTPSPSLLAMGPSGRSMWSQKEVSEAPSRLTRSTGRWNGYSLSGPSLTQRSWPVEADQRGGARSCWAAEVLRVEYGEALLVQARGLLARSEQPARRGLKIALVEHAADGHLGAIFQTHLREERHRAPREAPRRPAARLFDDGRLGLDSRLAVQERSLEKLLRDWHLEARAVVGHHHQLAIAGGAGLR